MAHDTDAIIRWLNAGTPGAKSPQDVLGGLAGGLVDAGVPLASATVFVATLHPNVRGRRFSWAEGQDVSVHEELYHDPALGTVPTPLHAVIKTGQTLRRQLTGTREADDFAVLDEMRQTGITDYIVQPITFTNGEIHAASWATKRAAGFSKDDIAAIEDILPPFSRLAEVLALRRTASNLLNTYVGRNSGERILQGHIRRGDTERIRAVIWLSDLRGFTRLINTRPGEEVIGLLNEHFDCIVPPIEAEGGEVLSYLGDGVLAIFPLGDKKGEEERMCRAALRAAQAAHDKTAARNAKKEPALNFGLGLHIGDLLYGNIGAANRLYFTAIGVAVNLSARLQTLARDVGQEVVTSAAFAGHCQGALTSLGEFTLAGFAEPQAAFAARLDKAG